MKLLNSFGLSLCKIVRSSVILLLPLFKKPKQHHVIFLNCRQWSLFCMSFYCCDRLLTNWQSQSWHIIVYDILYLYLHSLLWLPLLVVEDAAILFEMLLWLSCKALNRQRCNRLYRFLSDLSNKWPFLLSKWQFTPKYKLEVLSKYL